MVGPRLDGCLDTDNHLIVKSPKGDSESALRLRAQGTFRKRQSEGQKPGAGLLEPRGELK